jgi:hypothetical protein
VGDDSQPHWEDAPEWQREASVKQIAGVLAGNTPRQQHDDWCHQKREDGWVFGEEKDPICKTHPCLVDYDRLPQYQKDKDAVYVGVVGAVCKAFGVE